jgi:hypothetical protein
MIGNILKGFIRIRIWHFDLNTMEGKMGTSTTFSTMDNFYSNFDTTFDGDVDVDQQTPCIYEVQNMEETYIKHNKINVIFFGSI